jgi:hypothetical protein
MAFRIVDFPQPFSPSRPYRLAKFISMVESLISTLPWNTKLAEVILTSRLAGWLASTPVVTRSLMPCSSSCSVNFCTLSSTKSSASIMVGPSPSTDEALEAFSDGLLDTSLDDTPDLAASLEAAVFFVPSAAARFAWRAAFEAEMGMMEDGDGRVGEAEDC